MVRTAKPLRDFCGPLAQPLGGMKSVAIKGPDDVFIPALKIIELEKKEFKENGEITFILSKSGYKRLMKMIEIEENTFDRKGKRTVFGKFMVYFNGVRWLMKSMYGVLFDSHLENCSSFYIIHKSAIKEIQKHEYSESSKCVAITFIRKKNPPVSWPS